MNTEHVNKSYIQMIANYLVLMMDKAKHYRIFIISLLITLLFYLPALLHHSINAGLIYSGDILAYYLPAMMKSHSLLAGLHLTALDFSLFNGSSDYYLNANYFPLHPILVIYSLLIPINKSSVQSTGHFLVLMLAFHSFIACYFSLKVFTRYFLFEFAPALLIAIGFAFSWHMIAATMEPGFLFCTSIIPWTIYGALRYSEHHTFKLLLLASLPIILGLLGGYLPMALACLLLAVMMIVIQILYLNVKAESNKEQHIITLIYALFPFILAFLITSPYLYAVYKFLQETSSVHATNLFYSAHQLAELPQTFIRMISSYFFVPGPSAEFTVLWGIIACTIFSLFFLSSTAMHALTNREWRLFKVVALMYFATVLAIFGRYSVLSSLVYYLVPQIGKMHIYQRFLLPAHLLLMVMLTLMLKALVESRPQFAIKTALVLLSLLAFAFAFLMSFRSNYALMFGFNNAFLFELMLGCLFAGLLLIPGRKFVYYGTVILFSFPALTQMYALTQDGNTFAEAVKRQPIVLNHDSQSQLLNYLQRFNHKQIIKYVDITPMWTKSGVETFPKDFSRYVLNQTNLSSYSGTTFYLSSLAKYLHKMPIGGEDVAVRPDWQWLQSTGADFIVATKAEIAANELLQNLANKNKTEDLYNLPNDAVIIPITTVSNALFDNGYMRIVSNSSDENTNLALHKTAKQSGDQSLFSAELAVDGKTDGDFTHGTVTHTTQDVNAWLDIDLEKSDSIDKVKIWNRTDCCGERLQHYWVFISNDPFLPTDTVATLRNRANTWGEVGYPASPNYTMNTSGVNGRYVRVQLAGTQSPDSSYLSLAEVEVLKTTKMNSTAATVKNVKFTTNNANNMRLEFEANAPTTVQYLFWKNPRVKYYLNGKKVRFNKHNDLLTLAVPAGKNSIEIRYVHKPLMLFWLFYSIYALLLMYALIPKRLLLFKRRGKHAA